jgi:hypothetical protein
MREINDPDYTGAMPAFMGFSGTIKDIIPADVYTEDGTLGGRYYVDVENFDGATTTFIVDANTAFLMVEELAAGMEVTGFFDASVPVDAIYPPQHHARAISSGMSYTVDRFVQSDFFDMDGAGFISSDGGTFVHISEDTEIRFEDGTLFDGDLSELENRIFAFSVGFLAMSFPAQAMPDEITILFETAVPPILELTEEDLAMSWELNFDPETAQINVDNETISAPSPFLTENYALMVPAAYIAKALGYDVYGEGADIVIGRGITFQAGVDSYHYARMAPVELGAVPELRDGVLFVPLTFFGQVMPVSSWVSGGEIFVSSEPNDMF